MPEVVSTLSPSGPATILKSRVAPNFGSIPTPFVKEVTVAFAEADEGDLVSFSPAQALSAGVFNGGARVSAAGVVALSLGTSGGTTVTVNTVTVDVYLEKGSTAG